MKLSNNSYFDNKLIVYLSRAIGYKNCELEFIYGSNPYLGKIERKDFMRILDEIRQKYKCISEENSLDIRNELKTVNGKTILNNI